ncbi:MAG: ribonuclease E/G [Rickettsiales bacterium]|nr:ribonuclease E/G [Rickettsiales bacterium]
MAKRMLIDALHAEETRVVIADDEHIIDFDFVTAAKDQLKGNIYLAKITRVEPSLQAAFVEYGGGKQGFLPFSEIHPDYYQIPISDRIRLMEEVASEIPTDSSNEPAELTDNSQSESDQANLVADDKNEHPAYLVQGAIEESTASEEIEQKFSEMDNAEGDDRVVSLSEASLIEEPVPTVGDESDELVESTEQSALDLEAAPETPAQAGEGESKSEEVETLPSEDEEIRPKKNLYSKRYKIQEVVRRGQIVLVQVIKEERGNKGCSLTTFLSLAGRYCVLMPNSPKEGGISRKIMSPEDRRRLKSITTELKLASGMSVIIRTAGMGRTRAEIKRDYDYLVKVWNRIREDTLRSTAPALIYVESNIIKRSLRDQYTSDMDELVIEGEEAYQSAKEFMRLLLPSHTGKIKLHTGHAPLFYSYGIEDKLLSMHDPVVKLKSGGYIVINPTEALISIDVNSGRSTGERNIEETAVKTNIEAATEVARQLRLRDLAGLIVIDFIDMMESRNRRAVERALKDALKVDRAKIQLGRISPFGLLEMSRQRLRPSIAETNTVQCPHCVGRGYIRSSESMSMQVIRSIQKEASTGNVSAVKVSMPQATALYLLNTKRDVLKMIEERYSVVISIEIDAALNTSDYTVERVKRSHGERNNDARRNRNQQRPRFSEPDIAITDLEETASESEIPEEQEALTSDESTPANDGRRDRNRNRRRRRGGGNNRREHQGTDTNQEQAHLNGEEVHADAPEPSEADGTSPERKERSGNRNRRSRGGRRRWRDKNERDGGEQSAGPDGHTAGEPVIKESPAIYERPELPAFTQQPAKPLDVHTPKITQLPTQSAPDLFPSDSDKDQRKGWWQKMINLDG